MECSFPVPGVFCCRQFNVNVLQNRLINSQLLSKKRSVVFIFVVIYLLSHLLVRQSQESQWF